MPPGLTLAQFPNTVNRVDPYKALFRQAEIEASLRYIFFYVSSKFVAKTLKIPPSSHTGLETSWIRFWPIFMVSTF